jgi:hypothetical protein
MHARRHQSRVRLLAVGAALLAVLASAPAGAASYVYRTLTLPGSTFELGLGAGIARRPGDVGAGFNFELGYGIHSGLELRLRTGLRLGDEGRILGADRFGRPFETETYNLGSDSVANPEVGLRWVFARGGTAEIGLDWRITLPVSGEIGLHFGLPIALHLGQARLDTGVFVVFVFNEPETDTLISLPLHLFFPVGGGTYLGPITGVRFHEGGDESVPLGFGVGSALAYDADLRFWLLFPDVSEDGSARHFGVGVGLYLLF